VCSIRSRLYLVFVSSVSRGYPAAILVPRFVAISSLSRTLHKRHSSHSNSLHWTESGSYKTLSELYHVNVSSCVTQGKERRQRILPSSASHSFVGDFSSAVLTIKTTTRTIIICSRFELTETQIIYFLKS